MKTAELTGRDLDAWVAKALGYEHKGAIGAYAENDEGRPWCLSRVNDWWKDQEGYMICGPCEGFPYAYSSEWEHGGPIIEREVIGLHRDAFAEWLAGGLYVWSDHGEYVIETYGHRGPTPLIAAMRAFVASKFGRTVPDEWPESRHRAG